jgi:hypothetical protein
MKVKELKELLKDQPDDLEVILGSIDLYGDENYYFKLENMDHVELFHREIHTGQYIGVEYYMDTDRFFDPNPQTTDSKKPQITDSKKEVLLLYNKSCILLKELQPNILTSE